MVKVIDRAAWSEAPDRWHGELEGTGTGAGLSLIFFGREDVGGGPRLHRHPYPETFIIRTGTALFTVGTEELRVGAGQIVVVPAGVPHKFSNLGPGLLETIDIHASERFDTEWLE